MTARANILIVEDEAKMRRLLELNLGEDGFGTQSAADAETGLKLLQSSPVDLVVTDVKLPGMDGMEFLQAIKRFNAALPVVVMTAFGSVETAVEAMKAGASNYLLKPFSLEEMRMVVRKELDVRRLRDENRTLRVEVSKAAANGRGGVEIRLKDTGPGIPAELREQIFNPFVTTKKTGVGLGLSIVSKIVDEHRGWVRLEEPPGHGACFVIFLPLEERAVELEGGHAAG